jgi:hypothetical protein
MAANGAAGTVPLASLTLPIFLELQQPQQDAVVSSIKTQFLRRLSNEEWVTVCKAIRLFCQPSDVSLSTRTTLQKELTAILKADLAGLTPVQVGCTMELVKDLVPSTAAHSAVKPATTPLSSAALPRAVTVIPAAKPTPKPTPLPVSPTAGKVTVLPSTLAKQGQPANAKAKAKASVPFQPPRAPEPTGWHSSVQTLDTYKDNSISDRCQCIINGIVRAMNKGEHCCLLSGETFLSDQAFTSAFFSKKNKFLQRDNPGIPNTPPTSEQMKEALEMCQKFLDRMQPINRYVDHFTHVSKVEYEAERSQMLTRLSFNDELDRFRLEHDGLSYFGMKLNHAGHQRNGDTFVKHDASPVPYSHSMTPGQCVWISAEDAKTVDPVDKRVTATGEISSIGRESVAIRNLGGLPHSKNGLYRIDIAVTPINLERMVDALRIVRRQYEWSAVQDPAFKPWVPRTEEDKPSYGFGILEPGNPLSSAFFFNIHHTIANARDHYRTRFGAVPPPNLPENAGGFNSFGPPPPPVDGPPLTAEQLNAAAQRCHPMLAATSAARQPLDCSTRPLHRSQHWLNDNQLVAVTKIIDEARQVTLIQGPPGTGKTTTAIAIICEWVMWYHGRILATAHSNKGLDNLLQGLVAKGIKVLRVGRGAPMEGTDLGEYSLETLVERHPMNAKRQQLDGLMKEAQRTGQPASQEVMKELNKVSKMAIGRRICREAEVVCATCIGVGSYLMEDLQFDLVLVDEATQAVEPSAMIPITRGAKQLVMIGDQAQLPPTVKCPAAVMRGLDISIFDRLIGNGLQCHVLDVQYRMHPTISCFPSWRFYHSLLRDGVTAMERALPNGVFPTPNSRACFLEVPGQEEQLNTSKLNRMESNCVIWVVKQLMMLGGVSLSQIGVITPYAAQVRTITQAVQAAFSKTAVGELEVQSVDGFQGREKDFILLSMVRTKCGGDMTFITDWRRTNVALTRARYGVIVVGCLSALCQSPIWLDWLKFHVNSLLSWNPTSQTLGPVHPEFIEHVQLLNAVQEPFTMEEMMAQKLGMIPVGPPPAVLLPTPGVPKQKAAAHPKRAADDEPVDGQPDTKKPHCPS